MCWYMYFQLGLAISFGQFFITTVSRDLVVLYFASSADSGGIVRVQINGSSTNSLRQTICWDSNWGMANANVTCRQMGFLKGTSNESKTSAAMSSVIYNVRCTGHETNIADCSYSLSGTCTGGKHVDVTCSKNPAFDGLFDVRLNSNGSAANKGVVEVRENYADGTNHRLWFTQCYNLWSSINSNVICKQLGYSGAKTTKGIHGKHSNIAGGEIKCTGTEQTLNNCPVIPTSTCTSKTTYSEVECVLDSETQQRFDVRLTNGNESAGTVELLRYGRWGIICDYEWEVKSARVVCQQLGFTDAVRVTKASEFGQGNGPIYLRHPECKGNEWSLETCPLRYGWGGGINVCQTKDTAGVVCNPTKFPSYDISTTISTSNAAESTGRFFLHSPAFPKLFSYDSSTHLVCIMTAATITEFSLYIHYKMFQKNHQETLSFQASETQVSSRYFYSLKLYGNDSNPGPNTTKTQSLSMEFKSNGAKGMGKFRVEIRVPKDTAVTLNCSMVATTLAPPTTTTTTVVTTQGHTPTSVTNSKTTAHETTMSKATTQTNPTKGQGHTSTDKSTDKSTATITTDQTMSDSKLEGGLIGAAIMAMVLVVVVVILAVMLWKLGILKFRKYQKHQPRGGTDAYDDTRIEFTDMANHSSPTYVNHGMESDTDVDQSVPKRQRVQENGPESAYHEINDFGRGVSGRALASNSQATSDSECPYAEVYSKNAHGQEADYVNAKSPGTESTGRSTTDGAVGLERSVGANELTGDPSATNDSVGHSPETTYAHLDAVVRPVYMDFKELSSEQLRPVL